jgi:hypothetical protein
MDGNSRIAQHRLGTRGGNNNVSWFASFGIDHWVTQMPEVTLQRFSWENFVIADRSLKIGIPVDQTFAAIDPLFGKEIIERAGARPVRTYHPK